MKKLLLSSNGELSETRLSLTIVTIGGAGVLLYKYGLEGIFILLGILAFWFSIIFFIQLLDKIFSKGKIRKEFVLYGILTFVSVPFITYFKDISFAKYFYLLSVLLAVFLFAMHHIIQRK